MQGISEAVAYLRAKGYKIGFDYRDIWREEHARAFTIAKAMTQDVLIDIRKAVDTALAEGTTLEAFKKELIPFLAKRGWLGHTLINGDRVELGTPRRLKIMYDTNLRTAYAAGQWQRIQKSKRVLPYLLYTLGPSREHRDEHVRFNGLILPVDDSFWQTHYPPNGWGCKCRVRQISEMEAQRRGLSQRPKIKQVSWKNKRTGQVEQIPEGIDPGWDYNAGQSRLKQMQQFERQKEQEFHEVVSPD